MDEVMEVVGAGEPAIEQTDFGYRARCFNRGSDARIAGRGLGSNPHQPNSVEAHSWVEGWLDAQNFWGTDAKWPVRRLPRVA